jgi:hypothetical protein
LDSGDTSYKIWLASTLKRRRQDEAEDEAVDLLNVVDDQQSLGELDEHRTKRLKMLVEQEKSSVKQKTCHKSPKRRNHQMLRGNSHSDMLDNLSTMRLRSGTIKGGSPKEAEHQPKRKRAKKSKKSKQAHSSQVDLLEVCLVHH